MLLIFPDRSLLSAETDEGVFYCNSFCSVGYFSPDFKGRENIWKCSELNSFMAILVEKSGPLDALKGFGNGRDKPRTLDTAPEWKFLCFQLK